MFLLISLTKSSSEQIKAFVALLLRTAADHNFEKQMEIFDFLKGESKESTESERQKPFYQSLRHQYEETKRTTSEKLRKESIFRLEIVAPVCR